MKDVKRPVKYQRIAVSLVTQFARKIHEGEGLGGGGLLVMLTGDSERTHFGFAWAFNRASSTLAGTRRLRWFGEPWSTAD